MFFPILIYNWIVFYLYMKPVKLIEDIYSILKPYADPYLVFTPNSIYPLKSKHINELLVFLNSESNIKNQKYERPSQLNFGHTGSLRLYPWKKKMVQYIS